MALHKKPSCCGVKYSHMGSRVLQKTSYLPQSAAASRNATSISVTLGESYTSILCSDAAGLSGLELISESQNTVEMCAVLR